MAFSDLGRDASSVNNDGRNPHVKVVGVNKTTSPVCQSPVKEQDGSDYGSDFDTDGEEAVQDFLARAEGVASTSLVLESLIENVDEISKLAHVPLFSSQGSKPSHRTVHHPASDVTQRAEAGVYQRDNTGGEGIAHTAQQFLEENAKLHQGNNGRDTSTEDVDAAGAVDGTRSPLQRFRSRPNKTLSVTDLVSPAWCEMQYWYTLTKHGRKRRTPAMKQGSKVHRKLELEVHDFVPVEVLTREDAFGLRLWNTIQGLRTLRETGLTRELGVWDVIDGEVVQGMIDEVSQTCPDTEMEEKIKSVTQKDGSGSEQDGQRSITTFFRKPLENAHSKESNNYPGSTTPRVYITDLKTRASKKLPNDTALRPVTLQLMLYRRMLVSMATNNVLADTIFERSGLDSRQPFSHVFVEAITSLDGVSAHGLVGSQDAASDSSSPAFPSELETYNNLAMLWSLMIQECQATIPSADHVGNVMGAEFRWQGDGEVLGTRSFAYDAKVLERYIREEMSWWRGERSAKGVDIEDAFKCRICEFAEGCEWRIKQVEDAVARSRRRKEAQKEKK